MSFYSDKKEEHEDKAEKALAKKNYADAFFHTGKAAEFGLKLAERCEGKVAERYVNDANELMDIARKLKEKAEKEEDEDVEKTVEEGEEAEEEPSTWELQEKPDTKLEDVAGLDEVKKVLHEGVIQPFQHPEVYERFRQDAGAGVLMYGPPGNGKTFIARAIAGELDASFFPVDCAQIKNKYVGETEKNLKRVFEEARSRELAVLFFDEVEALIKKRGNRSISSVEQFLSLTDGIGDTDSSILLLAATNRPWRVDEAALRPGRLGTHIYVGFPDQDARERILELNLESVPLAEGVSLADIADRTEGYSGADMTQICRHAKQMAINRQIESEREEKVTQADLLEGLEKANPSVGQDMLDRFDQWREENARAATPSADE